MSFIELPEEDSPDVTEDEARSAPVLGRSEDMVDRILKLRCAQCQGSVMVLKHTLRRKAPHLYARVNYLCKDRHQGSVLFRADFLGGV